MVNNSRYNILFVLLFVFASAPAIADECTGDSDYQVCTSSSANSQGDETISSYDSTGNSYSITSGARDNLDGSTEVFSDDSEGNSYSIKSWCDSSGCHTEDSEGNRCTITSSGDMVGC